MSRAALAPSLSPTATAADGSLYAALAAVPDTRQAQGRRHPLAAVLALACAAMLCGARSSRAIADWGRNYDPALLTALGFTHGTPCPSTLHTIFRGLDWAKFAAQLHAWAEGILTALPPAAAPALPGPGLAIDGKTLRGSRKQGLPDAHLLSVVSHQLGITLTHTAVPEKTNEITAIQEVLQQVLLAGRVVTVDALLTQREVARTILAQGGDYVMVVKGNQPQLQADIAAVFDAETAGALERRTEHATLDLEHGRIERRSLTASDALVGYSDWPGLAQVFQLQRRRRHKKTGALQTECVYGVTSLAPHEASAAALLAYARGHWQVENGSHWVRDVTFDEDRSQVRCGQIPKVMATLRTTVINVLRWRGERNIAAAVRRLSAQPHTCLNYLGLQDEN